MYSKEELLDWLSQYEMAYKDIENYFGEAPEKRTCEEIVLWISEHDSLYDSLLSHFKDVADLSYDYDTEMYEPEKLAKFFKDKSIKERIER